METDADVELRNVVSKRHTVLDALRDGQQSKPDLVSQLECSRSTVDRAITELIETGCVSPTEVAGNEYRITLTGRLLFQTYREYCETTALLHSGSSLLNALSQNEPIDETFIQDATVYSSEKTPDIALQPAIESLPEASKLTGTAPVVFGEYFELLSEWLRAGEYEMELVIEADLLDSISDTYRSEFETLLESDATEFYVYDGHLPYALWLLDPGVRVGLTVYENGGIRGSLVNDTNEAIEWARNRYEGFRQSSTPVSNF